MAAFLTMATIFASPTLPSIFPLRQLNSSSTWRLNCKSRETRDVESTPKTSSSSWSISTYNWCTALGGVGFLETAYLTYLKLSGSDAFCPVNGGSCDDVLNSDYAVVFGVPLPVIGMVAYGLIAAVGLQLRERSLPFGIDESNGRLLLLGSTTSMATASGYFLYILSTRFPGVLCAYCLVSAFLSISLFFIIVKELGLQDLQKTLGLQLSIASLVIISLNMSYSNAEPISASRSVVNLEYFATEVTTPSSPFAVSLAKHLRSIGAKMYGAFWCSHCLEQKQMFGKEASEILDYVECFPDGYRTGIKMAKSCADAKIEGFPMWIINGQVYSGEQELSDLAKLSGFNSDDLKQQT